LINDLEVSTTDPTHEEMGITKTVKDTKPKMMIFDSKKPIANAPQGTIKVTMKSDLIPI